MNQLYPIKFKPIFKPYIWGGTRLKDELGKKIPGYPTAESWEISGVQGNISIVASGFLRGNSLQELIEIYMGDLVGDKVYERFGIEFPLLIKFIDANNDLSIQVHPDDETARIRHKAYGKTEMWYVLDAENKSTLISGFNRNTSKEEYLEHLNSGRLPELLNYVQVEKGDVFFIPAGRIHAIGKGILLTEIQQTSDITYRIFDWNRKDAEGKSRPLHTDLALDILDFKKIQHAKNAYTPKQNESVKLVQCPYFTTNRIDFSGEIEFDYSNRDSFHIYICCEGKFSIDYPDAEEVITVEKGDTVLVPAEIKNIELTSVGKASFLEVFIS